MAGNWSDKFIFKCIGHKSCKSAADTLISDFWPQNGKRIRFCGFKSSVCGNLLQQPYEVNQRRQWHPTPGLLLKNPMDGGAWWAAVHRVAKSQTRLGDFPFTFHFHALEKEMATHSSVLAWRIPGMGEPGGLLSVGSHRVGHDWSDLAAAAA